MLTLRSRISSTSQSFSTIKLHDNSSKVSHRVQMLMQMFAFLFRLCSHCSFPKSLTSPIHYVHVYSDLRM